MRLTLRATTFRWSFTPTRSGRVRGSSIFTPTIPFTLDPQNGSSFANPLGLQFFDTLVTYAMDFKAMLADQTKVVPRLAESWEISPDNKLLTFKLRRDAKFLGRLAGHR